MSSPTVLRTALTNYLNTFTPWARGPKLGEIRRGLDERWDAADLTAELALMVTSGIAWRETVQGTHHYGLTQRGRERAS